jgi:hypothetical protein
MTAALTPSDRDLRTLAGIVSTGRDDLPDQGLPTSLLSALMSQIRCDVISFEGFDSDRQQAWLSQAIPRRADAAGEDAFEPAHWKHYWDCQPCSYPDRTGDLRTVVRIADFYSARQWHSTGMFCDLYRPKGFEHELMLSLPAGPGRHAGPGRALRLFLFRGPGPDSARQTGRCSRCCGRICIRPTLTLSAAGSPAGRPPSPAPTTGTPPHERHARAPTRC